MGIFETLEEPNMKTAKVNEIKFLPISSLIKVNTVKKFQPSSFTSSGGAILFGLSVCSDVLYCCHREVKTPA